MPKDYSRIQRISELLKRQIALIIQREIADPRVKMVTISQVDVARDLSYAKVYISPVGSDDEKIIKERLRALKNASGFIRHLLRDAVDLRVIPQLNFVYDDSINRGIHLSQLIDQAIASDTRIQRENGEKRK